MEESMFNVLKNSYEVLNNWDDYKKFDKKKILKFAEDYVDCFFCPSYGDFSIPELLCHREHMKYFKNEATKYIQRKWNKDIIFFNVKNSNGIYIRSGIIDCITINEDDPDYVLY